MLAVKFVYRGSFGIFLQITRLFLGQSCVNQKIFTTLTKEMSEAIARILESYDICVTQRLIPTLWHLLTNVSDKD